MKSSSSGVKLGESGIKYLVFLFFGSETCILDIGELESFLFTLDHVPLDIHFS